MSKESTNVELGDIAVVGGEIITDGIKKTEIPPKGKLNIVSSKENETVVINLSGEWPPKTIENKDKEENASR